MDITPPGIQCAKLASFPVQRLNSHDIDICKCRDRSGPQYQMVNKICQLKTSMYQRVLKVTNLVYKSVVRLIVVRHL